MSSSLPDMDIEPDLNKAPPHIEGELLKQKDRAVIGRKKGWKKYFFVVYRDKLLYYTSVQDYRADKEPIAPIRLSHVLEITEAMFTDVPGRHYTNCGFTIVVIPPSTEKREFNLLAETPDKMRSWIRNLRYTKAYWSMKDYRETVISVDQERMLLDRLLQEEEDQKDVVFGDYEPDEEFVNVEASTTISVHFASGSTTLKVGPADQAGEVVERVSDRLSSSSAQLWVVNYSGKETTLDPTHGLHSYHPSSNRFYALDPVHRLLVVFIATLSHHVIIVESATVTAQEIIHHTDVSHALDLEGVANRGLFLRQESEEHLFAHNECPCEVLHKNGSDGKIERQSIGYLIVKNRSHSGTGLRSTVRSTIRHTKLLHSSHSQEYAVIEEDQEEAQSKALAMITEKLRTRGGGGGGREEKSPSPKRIVEHRRSTDSAVPSSPKGTPESKHRSLSEDVAMNRSRSGAIRRGGRALPRSPQHQSPSPSPLSSPSNSPLPGRRFPQIPTKRDDYFDSASGPSLSIPNTRTRDRSPSRRATINTKGSQNGARRRAPSILQVADTLNAEESRSSTFGSIKPSQRHTNNSTDQLPQASLHPQSGVDESERLEHLFSASYGSSQSDKSDELLLLQQQSPVDSLTSKIVEMGNIAINKGDRTEEHSDDEDHTPPPSSPQGPMVIDFNSLKRPVVNGAGLTGSTNLIAPMEIHTPSILKIVLLQAEATPTSGGDRAMDVISLSGVVLRYSKGAWQLAQGFQYHEALEQSEEKIEGFTLRGGVRVLYSHTKHCWYALPPLAPPPGPAHPQSPQENTHNEGSLTTSGESSAPADIQTLYLQKRAVTTEIGSAFHEILHLFSSCKSIEEKKRVGSDMTNLQLGYMIRGRLCSALAWLLLDGVKVQLFGGLVTRDVWKIVSAFVQDGIENESYSSIHSVLEGQVLRPIRAESRLSDNHMRFRSFVCLAISRGVFVDWLTQLPERRDTLKKYYSSTGLLPLASSDHTQYCKLFDEILLSLQPISVLPLELSIDFEIKQSHAPPRESHAPPTSGTSSTDGPTEVPQQRPAVAIDTTPTSLVNLHHLPEHINPQHTAPVVTERGTGWQPQHRPAQPQATPPAAAAGKTGTKNGSTWLQKLTYNLANLDMGGSLSGPQARQQQQQRNNVEQQRTPAQQPAAPSKVETQPPVTSPQVQQQPWSVQAVFSCSADKEDELSFSKGDMFTARYRINGDWLLCQREVDGTTKVGIVPSNFVKSI